jgi:hypothetical protein
MPHRHVGSGVWGIGDGGVMSWRATDLAEDDAKQQVADLNSHGVMTRITNHALTPQAFGPQTAYGSSMPSRGGKGRQTGDPAHPQQTLLA